MPARAAALRALLDELGLACVVETGARFALDPRRKHFPTLLTEGRDRRVRMLTRAVDVAAELGAPVVSMWSGAAPANLAPAHRVGAAARGRRARRRARGAARRAARLRARAGHVRRAARRLRGARPAARRTRTRSASRSTSATASAWSREPVSRVRAPRRGPARPRAHRGHAARRARAPDVRRRRARPRRSRSTALAEIGYGGLVAVELSRHAHAAHETVPRAIALLRGREREEVTTSMSGPVGRARATAWRPRRSPGCARRSRRSRPTRPRSARASRWPAARRAARRSTRTPTPTTSTRGRSTTRRARCCCSPLGDRAARSWPTSTASATPPSAAGCCARCRTCRSAPRALGIVDDAIRTNDTRLDRGGARAVRDGAPRRRRLRPGGAQVRVHRRADRAARRAARARDARDRAHARRVRARARRRRPRHPGRGLGRDRPLPAGRRAGGDRGRARERVRGPPGGRRARAAASPQGGSRDEDLRAARAHDVAHHRRLRGDGGVGREGARRAGVLARPAAHVGRLVRRLLQLAARLGALPRRRSSASATTARSGSTRRRRTTTRCGARCSPCCRASWPRTASSPSGRSATTR